MSMLLSKSLRSVVIAGGGPTGMMLAGELALAGVDAVIVERRTNQDVDGARAGGLLSRTVEVLDQRGIAERFLSAGQTHPIQGYAGMFLNIRDFPTRHNYTLALWQSKFEPILAAWIADLGVPILRGCEVVGFAQDDSSVHVEISDGQLLRAEYLAGCDGGRSLVRKTAGIDFAGLDPSTSGLVAEVEMNEEPPFGMRHDSIGSHGMSRIAESGAIRVVLTERRLQRADRPTLDELRGALVACTAPTTVFEALTGSPGLPTCRGKQWRTARAVSCSLETHRTCIPPHGGQGLNIGVQDAVNLVWKLAQVVRKRSPESLLDTYHDERHPIGAQVLHNTMAQAALSRPDERHKALRGTMSELMKLDEPRKRIAGMLSGLDIHYKLGEGHPLVGRRMPDLDLVTAGGPTRWFTLLHSAQPVLLNLGEPGGFDISPWANRVRLVAGKQERRSWELPVLGEVPAPPAVLIRPDGYVAWTGDLAGAELPRVMECWFGPGTPGA